MTFQGKRLKVKIEARRLCPAVDTDPTMLLGVVRVGCDLASWYEYALRGALGALLGACMMTAADYPVPAQVRVSTGRIL